jgi:predicted PurR-regulated permease PerM
MTAVMFFPLSLPRVGNHTGLCADLERCWRSTGFSQPDDTRCPVGPGLAPGPVPILNGRTSVTGAALRVSLVVAGVVLALLVAYQLLELILMFVVALIVAAAMNQPAAALERRGLPRPATILITYAGLLAAVGALILAIAGPLVSEVQALIENAPEILSDLRQQAVDLIDGLANEGTGEDVVQYIEGALAELDLTGLIGIPLQAAGIVINIIIIVFLSAFLVYERDRFANWLLPLVPPAKRRATQRMGRAVFGRLGRFIHGQLLLMTIMGVGMFVGLVLLGIPFALPLALFAFVVEAIPMIGPWVAMIPAVAVAFAESPTQALLLIVWWTIIQQIEGYVLTPTILGKIQHLSGTVVLLSVLGGFQLFGIIGALIAVPVVAAVSMVIEAVFRPARKRAVEKRGAPSSA